MEKFKLSPVEMVASSWRNRGLIFTMTHRDVVGRYKGSFFGLFWSFFNPVLLLAVYTFVFSSVMKARWNPENTSKTEFAVVLFAGMIVYNLFAECINRSPSLVLSQPNYVKKVIFPLEILPWINLGSALFHSLISLIAWLTFYVFLFGAPKATSLYLPIVLLPLIFLNMGLSWFLASLGVFLRDVAQFIGLLTTTLMFMSPVFYSVSSVPEAYQDLFQINPLTPIIEMARDALIWGKSPDWMVWSKISLGALCTMILGFAWFQKTRKGFADVL